MPVLDTPRRWRLDNVGALARTILRSIVAIPKLIGWLFSVAVATIASLAVMSYLIGGIAGVFNLGGPTSEPNQEAADVDAATVCACLDRSLRAYSNPTGGSFRYADLFWLEGGVFGWIDDSQPDAVYVVFRGTSELGNWFLTNAQAHFVTASSVLGSDVPGGVHRGFAEAFTTLWTTTDNDTRAASVRGWPKYYAYSWSRWLLVPIWSAVLFGPVLLAIRCGWKPRALNNVPRPAVLLLLVGILVLTQWFFAAGQFQASFMRSNQLVVGPSLSAALDRVRGGKTVVFTGHSLGGAIATLAFANFVSRAEPSAPASLVTFGAPRPGEGRFLEWVSNYTKTDSKKAAFLADRGDPVAHLPPAAGFWRRAMAGPRILGSGLASLYWLAWQPYALAYAVRPDSAWEDLVTWSGEPGMEVQKHTKSYRRFYMDSDPECQQYAAALRR